MGGLQFWRWEQCPASTTLDGLGSSDPWGFAFPVHSLQIMCLSWFSLSVCPQSLRHVWLFATPMDYNPPGSSVHGIPQARILEWVATSSSRGSFWPRDGTHVSYINRWIFFLTPAPREAPENQYLFIKEKWENLKTLKKQISTQRQSPSNLYVFCSFLCIPCTHFPHN